MRRAVSNVFSRHKMRAWGLVGVASSLGLGIVAACGNDSGGATASDAGAQDAGRSDALLFEPPPAPKPVSLAVGGSHACVIMDDGRLLCWGSNEYGQLGNPQATVLPDGGSVFDERPVPYPRTASVRNVAQVALGGPDDEDAVSVKTTCAVLSDAQVQCWGENRFGGLGRGDFRYDKAAHPDPQPVVNLGPSEQVVTNGMTSCALSDGRVWCWGRGQGWAEDGGGSGSTGTTTPTEFVLSQDTTAKQIALGQAHGLALTNHNGVIGWGNNSYGQLGDGLGYIDGLRGNVVEVAGAAYTTCARLRSGDVQCLGNNAFGMLGRGPIEASSSDTPAPVLIPTRTAAAIQIAMESRHVCVLLNDGTVWCWGQNFLGGLGSGKSNGASVDPPESSTPLKVEGLPNPAIAIGAGLGFSCALLSDHSVACWGRNEEGNLGQGTIDGVPHLTPVRVPL